ncbi:MAG: hypothetical protein IT384_18935 [Deltaproteobacteria bacterium]|nr:hypothetical protein [Deltaproteobacteria bacterium]
MASESEASAANPIAGWVGRQIDKGYKGFELYARDGAALSLVDRYTADRSAAEAIWADAKENASGAETTSAFVVRALNDAAGPYPSRSFSIPPPMPLHEPERFEERNAMRLLLEHIDKQNKVLTQVVPACLAAMGGMVQGLSAHFGTLAETHKAAIRTLRDGRVASLDAERAMMLDAARQARIDKLIDAGIAMLPQVLEHAATEKKL